MIVYVCIQADRALVVGKFVFVFSKCSAKPRQMFIPCILGLIRRPLEASWNVAPVALHITVRQKIKWDVFWMLGKRLLKSDENLK